MPDGVRGHGGSAEQSPTAPQLTAPSDVKARGREAQHAVAPGRHGPRTWPCFSLCSVFSLKPPLPSARRSPPSHTVARRQAPDPAAGAQRTQPGPGGTEASSMCQLTAGRALASITLPAVPLSRVPNPGGRGAAWGREAGGPVGPPSVCLPRPTASLVTRRDVPYLP